MNRAPLQPYTGFAYRRIVAGSSSSIRSESNSSPSAHENWIQSQIEKIRKHPLCTFSQPEIG
jgi:hypothetical protein